MIHFFMNYYGIGRLHMNTWTNHSSKTFRYVLYNPSWKEILELQRKLGNKINELGIIFVSGSVNNIQDFSKVNSRNICVWYGFRGEHIHSFLKHVDNQSEKYKEDIYLIAKEAFIKEQANKWKDKIDPRVFDALMNYEVDIDD